MVRQIGGGYGDLAFAGACREWDGNMASVVVNGALGAFCADMRLVLRPCYWFELVIRASGHHYQKDR